VCRFRSVDSYPHVAPRTTAGNPGPTLDVQFAESAGVAPWSFDEQTGVVTFGEGEPDRYGVLDEIARGLWHAGARVLAVRRDDTLGLSPVAAIVRYAAAFG
jgi:hypothetical protein